MAKAAAEANAKLNVENNKAIEEAAE